MKGSGKDENKRAPMYWSEDSADDGMCKGPALLSYLEDVDIKDENEEEGFYMPCLLYTSFARGIGEYGSVIYISGNSARHRTQVVSYVIMQKLSYIDYASGTEMCIRDSIYTALGI